MIRASSPAAPDTVTRSGLTSISAMSGAPPPPWRGRRRPCRRGHVERRPAAGAGQERRAAGDRISSPPGRRPAARRRRRRGTSRRRAAHPDHRHHAEARGRRAPTISSTPSASAIRSTDISGGASRSWRSATALASSSPSAIPTMTPSASDCATARWPSGRPGSRSGSARPPRRHRGRAPRGRTRGPPARAVPGRRTRINRPILSAGTGAPRAGRPARSDQRRRRRLDGAVGRMPPARSA